MLYSSMSQPDVPIVFNDNYHYWLATTIIPTELSGSYQC